MRTEESFLLDRRKQSFRQNDFLEFLNFVQKRCVFFDFQKWEDRIPESENAWKKDCRRFQTHYQWATRPRCHHTSFFENV